MTRACAITSGRATYEHKREGAGKRIASGIASASASEGKMSHKEACTGAEHERGRSPAATTEHAGAMALAGGQSVVLVNSLTRVANRSSSLTH